MLMVFLPLFISILVVIVGLQTSLGSYWYSLEMMYKDENGIQSAQSLIYTYQQELWENNWGEQGVKKDGEAIMQSDAMYHLEKKLSNMGYYILVKKNGNLLYSNISEEDMEAARGTAGEALHTAKTITASAENVSVIKNTFYHDTKEFSIIAVNSGKSGRQAESYLQTYIMKYVFIFIALFFVLTVLLNWVLSCWLSRSVLIPLKRLSQGTRKIRDGSLDEVLVYERNDEFGEVVRDFEEMRKYLKESVEQRLENEQRRREMIIGVSHDLRTPLTSIGGYLDGLLDGIADTPAKRKRYLYAIQTRTRDLERLVDSLSEYNRLDSKGVKYNMEYGDLKVFFEQYLCEYKEEAKNNGVHVTLRAEDEPYPVYFDGGEMKRVVDNLFTNTVRYRERMESSVHISLKKEMKATWVKIIFQDDGPGVPKDSLERIFDTFYRADNARSHTEKGSGIGLAVVREIIAGHGGEVYAENRQGLSVIIKLPMVNERRRME